MLEEPNRDDTALQSYLDGIMVDYPGLGYLVGLRDQLRPPDGFDRRNLKLRRTRDFLIEEGLLAYFENGLEMRKAREIFHRPRAREFVESMLLGGAPELAIARRLVDFYKMRGITPRSIQFYAHYYFNLELLDSTETRAILTLKMERLYRSTDAEESVQGQALRNAFYNDPRRAAALMPHSPISAAITQLQMGFIPESVDLKKVTEQGEMLAYFRLVEALSSGGRDFDHKALNLATAASILQKLKETKLKPEDELKNQLNSLAVKTAESGLPSVHEVTGGRHTVDMAALPESKEPDEPSKK